MRIVAGRFRATNLFVPDIPDTRPTMDRTRQAVFNILRSASWALNDDGTPLLPGAHVLDVFAGSGAMGFEALSQGASAATFFEMHPTALQIIDKNRQKLKVLDVTRVIKGDVQKTEITGQVAKIAFFDPPYHDELLLPALKKLTKKNFIDPSTLLVLEMHKDEELQAALDILDTRIYGTSKMIFARLETVKPIANMVQ